MAGCGDPLKTTAPYVSENLADPVLETGVYRVDIIDPVLRDWAAGWPSEVKIVRSGKSYVEITPPGRMSRAPATKTFALKRIKNNLYASSSLAECEDSKYCNDLMLVKDNGRTAFSWMLTCDVLENEFMIDLSSLLSKDDRSKCKFSRDQLRQVYNMLVRKIGKVDRALQPYSAATRFIWDRRLD